MTCFYRMSDDRVKMAVLFSTFYPVLQLKTTTQAHAHVVASMILCDVTLYFLNGYCYNIITIMHIKIWLFD